MGWPLRIHLLELLQKLHSVVDGLRKCNAILVVEELMNVACQNPLLILRGDAGLTRSDRSMRRRGTILKEFILPCAHVATSVVTIPSHASVSRITGNLSHEGCSMRRLWSTACGHITWSVR